MTSKRKRTGSNPLPTDLLSSLESSDKQAAKLRRSQLSTETLPRSFAAKSQVDIQVSLMESRILLQRALSAPLQNFEGSKVNSALKSLLSELTNARRKLCSASVGGNSSDSGSEDENVEEDRLEIEYSKLKEDWKTTLNKHHSNVHLQAQQNKNKFQVVDQSFWTQVENNVKHSAILEHSADDDDQQKTGIGFDDSKLYQHMLQEYIQLSTERGKEGAASAAADRLKRSLKKKSTKKDVDRRASKGRKIRYVVHEKLMNFTFPVQREVSIMDEDVLFKSMLGGVVQRR
jgi:hypothetical protein